MTAPHTRISTHILGSTTHSWLYGNPAGEALILVHGFRGDHHGLAGIAERLSDLMPALRIIVPDLPGFGQSPAIPNAVHTLDLYGTWLLEFTRAVAPQQASILGHSFGSLVVANALSQGLVSARTTLINPISAPALEGPKALLTKLALMYYRTAEALPERPARMLLGHRAIVRIMSEVMAKTRDRELRAWIHGQHQQYFSVFSDTTTLSEAFRASVSHTVLEYAKSFTTRNLLIVGDRDDITPLTDQLVLRDRLSDARLIVMPGVGHLVHYEAVYETAAAIRTFLMSTPLRDEAQ